MVVGRECGVVEGMHVRQRWWEAKAVECVAGSVEAVTDAVVDEG